VVTTDDQQEIVEQVERFARKELHPLQPRMDDEEWWPEHVFPLLGSNGYLGVTAPAELGGAGLDFFTSGLVVQAVARWNPAIGLALLAHENLCLHNVVVNANEELLSRFVPGMCDGTVVGALGLTEPSAGSDALGGMRTTARRDGEDYFLTGTKLFITNGPIADVVLLYAKTSPARGAHGISAFLVDTTAPGFTVSQKLIKMGMRGCQTAELVLEDCRVPAANLVGEEDRGVAVLMSGLDLERIALAFMIVGMAERALELTIEYARSRRQFNRRSPASSWYRAWWPTCTRSSSRCAASPTRWAGMSARWSTAPPDAPCSGGPPPSSSKPAPPICSSSTAPSRCTAARGSSGRRRSTASTAPASCSRSAPAPTRSAGS
jgi:isovaleryl-CoA dehydrogenase